MSAPPKIQQPGTGQDSETRLKELDSTPPRTSMAPDRFGNYRGVLLGFRGSLSRVGDSFGSRDPVFGFRKRLICPIFILVKFNDYAEFTR
jgi:hypothetical protein